jgi:hypothetical protein
MVSHGLRDPLGARSHFDPRSLRPVFLNRLKCKMSQCISIKRGHLVPSRGLSSLNETVPRQVLSILVEL